jgi:NAD-specific glutamate dehydrogenase
MSLWIASREAIINKSKCFDLIMCALITHHVILPHAQRTGESCWQKFKDVKAACRKMRGIHDQIKEKSGWTEADKKEAANKIWELNEKSHFVFWEEMQRLQVLFDAECTTANALALGLQGQKKAKKIEQIHVIKEQLKAQLVSHCKVINCQQNIGAIPQPKISRCRAA